MPDAPAPAGPRPFSGSPDASERGAACEFWKYHGAGNSFVLIEAPEDGPGWAGLATRMCAEHWAVGADGLLVCLPSRRARLRMRMFNPDGTEDMCGNGLRCVALHDVLARGAPDAFAVDTRAGIRRVEIMERHGLVATVCAEMGRADLRPEAIPACLRGPDALNLDIDVVGESVRVSALSTGSAHAVILGPLPDDDRFYRLSRGLEKHSLFPERVSVMWAEPVGAARMALRIWERGVGETLACGTGACAAAVVGRLSIACADRVEIRSRGGCLWVDIGPALELRLTGPAVQVLHGEWYGKQDGARRDREAT
jgi:diaminopimelate epimerase